MHFYNITFDYRSPWGCSDASNETKYFSSAEFFQKQQQKLDGVALLVEDPSGCNSPTMQNIQVLDQPLNHLTC